MDLDQNVREALVKLLKPRPVCVVAPVVVSRPDRASSRLVVLSPWRGYLVTNKQCVGVESTFSYLEIFSIAVHGQNQLVLETDTHTLSFTVPHIKDLEAIIGHMTASLKKVFPDSSPGKLLKAAPPDLHHRLLSLTARIEDQLSSQPGCCGGFSETYAALCDFNEMPFREEIQWDVDNIYHRHRCRQFSLQDFSHVDSRDLAVAISALSFNQWFTAVYSKDLRLSAEIQQQLMFVLSRSPGLQQLSLEASGLKPDFAVNMAAALQENSSSALRSINLSGNPLEDKGVLALSQELKNLNQGLTHLSLSRVQMTARGLGGLSQVLFSSQLFSASLTHLDLSANSNSLVTEDATFLFRFLSSTNCLSHLDLSDTSCPLDTLFVSLSAGCHSLTHLNLARNPFSHRKVREVTRSVQEFFSRSGRLKFVCLSGTKLPPAALRLLLQGLAVNTGLSGLELDVSSCELCSAGAMVIQEHISEAAAIMSLDISDNGLENDMVTLVLSLARCRSLQRLALGRNFTMKSRALTDVLHRIAQLVQDEECPLRSLSVCDSKLKSGTHILLSALGGHAALAELDISGNAIGDVGAKMLAKALMTNTRLRKLQWDRNNVSARGFQDVADALERNFTLQQVPLPLADFTQSYRGSPDRTRDALLKIQTCLDRNKQRQSDSVDVDHQLLKTQRAAKTVHALCQRLQDDLQSLSHRSLQGAQEVQEDVVQVHEALQNAREALKLLPSLYGDGVQRPSEGDSVDRILAEAATALAQEFSRSLQELGEGVLRSVESACPRVVQRSGLWSSVSECMSSRSTEGRLFLRTAVESAGTAIRTRLQELRRALSVAVADGVLEQLLQELALARDKLDQLLKQNPSDAERGGVPVPDLQLDFPQDDYSPAVWRNAVHSRSLRPASSLSSLADADWEKQSRGRARGEPGAEEGRCGLPVLLTATPLPLQTSGHSPSPSSSPSPSPPGPRGRRRKEGEAVDAAEAGASFLPPPRLPLLRSGCGGSHPPEAPPAGRRSSPGPGPGPGPPVSPMEPLPTQGQTLRHYTASRPRPRRKHSQPPSARPQESQSKVENEASEAMGRVDEGVEEFFTKRIIPGYALKGRWEESNPAQATPPESSSTPSVSAPFSSPSDIITPSIATAAATSTASVDPPAPPPTDIPPPSTEAPPVCTSPTPPSVAPTTALPPKNIKKKFGDFFAFKRARAGRAAKAGGGEGGGGGGGGEGVKVKRTSIADLIRPLREAKERERERERGKEREKERGPRSVEDANVSNDAAVTEGTIAASLPLAGDAKEKMVTATTPPSDTTPSFPAVTTSPERTAAPPCDADEGGGPGPGRTRPETPSGKSPFGERKLKVARTLREGKSQSLILLTGLEPEDKDGTPSKKHVSESGSSLEQRLQVMLHRMGMAKTPPADTKMSQSKDEELRKANSEGAILDKPAPPPTSMKPRTMSTSSADPRHPLRALDPIRPEPVLHPKPAVPERPVGPLPPKPAIAAKPTVPVMAAPAGGAAPPPSAPEGGQLGPQDSRSGEAAAQNGGHESPRRPAATPSPHKEGPPAASSPWRVSSTQDRTGKAQSVTEESLPKPRLHVKPLPQRRAVSVHEDALAMTQELKTVLQRSPVRFRGTRGDPPSCAGNQSICEETQRAQAGDTGRQPDGDKDGVLLESGGASCGGPAVKTKPLSAGKEDAPACGRPSCPAQDGQETSPSVRLPAASPALDRLAQTHILEESHVSPASHKESPAPRTPENPRDPPPSPQKTPSTSPAAAESCKVLQVKPLSHKKSCPGPVDLRPGPVDLEPGPVDLRPGTQQSTEEVSSQHTVKTEPTDQRTEPLLSD
ncbi:capping protein, Arp2/3 and myosin-I linker protein 2 isoform X2 [Salarias fasciatus]|uniref:capping protein, Arp2/3 and myosin-I linker protein 2 isoform X2 n=1 Tax=Salarias fasciatus TaxID=181472 RepID=UPI001176B7CC|nr:capping protein, Arp2/3 and myosin-I linker protein 3-like isoform X2 [Salarias fasciatus]